jgi:poly(beta-D-mannuronate) lyase
MAGDEICWKDGNYVDIKINFFPKANGTPQKPIILKAQTAGKVSFSGNSTISIGGNYLQVEGFLFEGNCTLDKGLHVIDFRTQKPTVEADHCRVTNCAIINYSLTEESGLTNYYVNLVGTYNELDHCYFTGKINKGPTVVVEYKQGEGYVPGSDMAPSTHHHIHHNYFGYRTFSSNGGEQLRVGTSTTSFSRGFNIVEYNYLEDERIEAEIISNKSCDNIYRFNTFIGNDGGMVIRHGSRCFVYNNYMNGISDRKESAGLRIVNPNNTVFNNYVEHLKSGGKGLKAPITIMAGLLGSEINGYFPADNAIVAYNTIVNSEGPAITVGVGNTNKGKPLEFPKNVLVVNNSIINTLEKNTNPVEVSDTACRYTFKNNLYSNGISSEKGFTIVKESAIEKRDGFSFIHQVIDEEVVEAINIRLAIQNIKLTSKEITQFNTKKVVQKKDAGVSWKIK